MKTTTRIFHLSLADALSKGPPPTGNLAVPIFSRGSLVVELYTPVGKDPQKPHTRDEVYFITRGRGLFFDGEQRCSVEAGSFLFVPAGHIHRFEDFSSDFVAWVAFYGPEGGESDDESAACCPECGAELVAPAPTTGAPASWHRIVVVEHEVEAERLDLELTGRRIPHIMVSYSDSAFDGIFQTTRGWGHVEASKEHRDAILAILEDIRQGRSESESNVPPNPD